MKSALIILSLVAGLNSEPVSPLADTKTDTILSEYKQEYAEWKKEQEIKKTVERLVSPYSQDNKENQRTIARAFLVNFNEQTAKTALEVARNESGFRSKAENFNTNNTYDKGCWQINDVHGLPDTVRLNCKKATEWAVGKVKRDKGFGAWVAYHVHVKGKYE